MKHCAMARHPRSPRGTLLKPHLDSVLAMLLLAVVGCTDTEATKNTTVNPSDACSQAAPIDPTALIDDFEDGDENLPTVAGRNGSWWTAGDDTAGAHYEPGDAGTPLLLPEARCDSRFALRFTGSGFQEWGALIGMSFAYAPDAEGVWGAVSHDASEHRGVRFWARIGDTASANVDFTVSGRLQGTAPDPCPEPEPSSDGCTDSFSAPLSGLSTDWKYYEIPFSGLTEHPLADLNLDTSALYSLFFLFAPSTVFDFWVDDMSFY